MPLPSPNSTLHLPFLIVCSSFDLSLQKAQCLSYLISLRMRILLHQGLTFIHSNDVHECVGHGITNRHRAAANFFFGKSFRKVMALMGKLHPLMACGNANPDFHILNSYGFDLTTSN